MLQAAAALWRLLAGSAQLADHLAALRKYFLLGAGDFWHAFLMQVEAAQPLCFRAPQSLQHLTWMPLTHQCIPVVHRCPSMVQFWALSKGA